MAYLPTGFTLEEEKLILSSQEKSMKMLDEISSWTGKQEMIRTITTVSIIAGLIYTMAQMGNLIAQVRGRHKTQEKS